MASQLPENISLRRLARSGASLQGRLDPESLPRLGQLAKAVDAAVQGANEGSGASTTQGTSRPNPVQVDLGFSTGSLGLARITGQLQTEVLALCQRCLEPMRLALALDVDALAIDAEDESTRERARAAGFEVIETEDGGLNLAEFVEEELLLAMPDYPMHRTEAGEDCHPQGASPGTSFGTSFGTNLDTHVDTQRDEDDITPRSRPFEGLRALLEQHQTNDDSSGE